MGDRRPQSPLALAASLMLAVAATACVGTAPAPPTQTPSSAAGATSTARVSSSPTSPEIDCGTVVALHDPDGLVAACDARIEYGMDGHEGLQATTTQVVAQWTGAMCTADRRATVQNAGTGFVLSITEHSPPWPSNAPSCAGGVQPVALTITFRSPISSDVRATVNGHPLPPLKSPPPSPSGDAAQTTCLRILGSVSPMVSVRSGEPTVAAAYEVTGEQMTSYFVVELNHSDMSNGADWWSSPTKTVFMCVLDGDFQTQTPGPPGHDMNATRVLVVDGSDAFPWAFCFSNQTSCGISTTDPATLIAPGSKVPIPISFA